MIPTGAGPASGRSGGLRESWKVFLRDLEAELGTTRQPPQQTPTLAPAQRVSDVGDRRDFQVVQGDGGFNQIIAEVRAISARAILYVDLEALEDLPPQEVERFGAIFDDPIYSVEVDAFGATSDVDTNEKVIILFTPQVNRLSTPGSGELIGGFVFGLDLFIEAENSNAAEILYVMVPDPTGRYGNVQSLDLVRSSIPAILAHEFQHMINHNERIIERGGERADAFWLSEALAPMGEDLVGEERAGCSFGI